MGRVQPRCMKCLRQCIESGIRAYFTAARMLHMAKRAEKARKHDLSVAKIAKHSDPYTTATSAFFWEVKDDVETVLPRPRRGHYNGQARSQCLIIRVFWNTAKCRSWCWPTVDVYAQFETFPPPPNKIATKLSPPPSSFFSLSPQTYQIIVADAADAVSVNFSGRCKFLQI